ncbi:hypothetical protein GCM10028808_73420 [Spirosoma migulaei]
MAIPTNFIEQNDIHTPIVGEPYPVWISETKLGKEPVHQTISLWQLSDMEIETIKDTGVVFLKVYGYQPPIEIIGGDPVEFEGQNFVYKHPDCRDLPVYRKYIKLAGAKTIEITSAWALQPGMLQQIIGNNKSVTLRVIGAQPQVEVFANFSID